MFGGCLGAMVANSDSSDLASNGGLFEVQPLHVDAVTRSPVRGTHAEARSLWTSRLFTR